jgi:hypothetical protein
MGRVRECHASTGQTRTQPRRSANRAKTATAEFACFDKLHEEGVVAVVLVISLLAESRDCLGSQASIHSHRPPRRHPRRLPRPRLLPHLLAAAQLLIPSGCWTLLPKADHIARGVVEGRYPQVALRIRWRHNLPAVSNNFLQRLIDTLDEDIGENACLSGNRQVGHEVPDHVAASILEARIVAIRVHGPSEHTLVEGG